MRRVTGWTAAVTVLVLALGACGGGAGERSEPDPGTLISASVDRTSRGTAAVSAKVALRRGDDSATIQTMEGEQDFEAQSSSLSIMSPLSRFDPSLADQHIDMIGIGNGAYQRIEGLELPAGKEWVAYSSADFGVTESDRQAFGSGDPADGLQFLSGVRKAREVGTAEVRGTPTTKYAVTIDLDRMMDLLAKGSKVLSPQFGRMLKQLRAEVDLANLPGAVWLDGQGRVRRFEYSIDAPNQQGISTVATTEFYDFGEPVSIVAPPVDETVPFAEVADAVREFLARAAPQPASDPGA
jgi:hypothetical protein